MVELKTLVTTIDFVSDAVDIASGVKISYAEEYGIKGYSSLKKDLAGTDLEAHHIIEVCFLKRQNLGAKNA